MANQENKWYRIVDIGTHSSHYYDRKNKINTVVYGKVMHLSPTDKERPTLEGLDIHGEYFYCADVVVETIIKEENPEYFL